MKRLGILLLICLAAALILLPILMRSSRKSALVVERDNSASQAIPSDPTALYSDTLVMDSSPDYSRQQASKSLPAQPEGEQEPMPEQPDRSVLPALIIGALTGIVILAWIVFRVFRKRNLRSESYDYADQSYTRYEPAAVYTKPEPEVRPDYKELIKQLITDNNLRPLGNRIRLALYDSENGYNVRMLLFSSEKNAKQYYQLILSYARYTPPPVFIEIIRIYIPKTIFAEKYGILLPNENNDTEGTYRSWLRDCLLTSNDTLRLEKSTDHQYSELHQYVGCVYEWTILASEDFSGAADGYPEIWEDNENNSYPALKMKGAKDAIMPPKKPDPKGDWLGVVFIIMQFEEALYGKASINLLVEVVGKEKLAGTVLHGGDLLPDASNWCLAIHTASTEQYDEIKKAVSTSEDPHFAPVENRIIELQDPASFYLPYQGYFSQQGEFI